MDRFQRIFKLHAVISRARRPVPRRELEQALECSRSTIVRVIEEMQLYLGAPLEYDRKQNGWYYNQQGEHPYELPGLWFNASELYALLTVYELLGSARPGFLDSLLAPLHDRIEEILNTQSLPHDQLRRRVRILGVGIRTVPDEPFRTVGSALLQRKRLQIRYHARSTDAVTDRIVSPQRLIHYRGNWHLDAWCHNSEQLRNFSVDRIRKARLLKEKAQAVDDNILDDYYTPGYGIFGGPANHTAVLRFTPEHARWVADEEWHPQQQGEFLDDGRYELRIPYSDHRELIMDILKHGDGVEVIEPASLRTIITQTLFNTYSQYQSCISESNREVTPNKRR